MDSRKFNSFAHNTHEIWAAKRLNMTHNTGDGPDLIAGDKITEVKFTKFPNQKNYYKWMALEYQMKYPETYQRPGFWAAGLYQISKDIDQIDTTNLDEIEKLITSREMYIVNWDWIYQFAPSPSRGKSPNSKWNNMIRYPKLNKMPNTTEEIEVEGGLIKLTEGVNPAYFEHLLK